MAVTIKDLLELEIMRDFKVVAGAGGLSKTVTGTEILDFEFIEEGEAYRAHSFYGNSIALSSLLFAKDSPELILGAVKKLIQQDVRALAYKPVFFKELPREALDFAEKMDFPILKFGRDEFFEDIIFSIKKLQEKDDILLQAESLFKKMIDGRLTEEETAAARERLAPAFRSKITAVCIKVKNMTVRQITESLRKKDSGRKAADRFFAGKLENSFMILLSQEENDPAGFKVQLEDALLSCGLSGKEMTMGISGVRDCAVQMDRAVREAFWTEKVAEIEKTDVKRYKDLGIYKLIISNIHTGGVTEYMEEYLAPLFEAEDKDEELLRTAVEYILANGDTIKTAERLFCHKNTIRYRIGKLQEKLDPGTGEKEFYQNLAAAVKIYLLVYEK